MSAASESYYWGKHRPDSLLWPVQFAARDSSGLTALLTDRAMLGPVGRHAMPDDETLQSRERRLRAAGAAIGRNIARRLHADADAAAIARINAAFLAQVQDVQR